MKNRVFLTVIFLAILSSGHPASAITVSQLNLTLDDGGDADVDVTYQLSFLDIVMYDWLSVLFGDDTDKIGEGLEDVLEKDVILQDYGPNSASFRVLDFIEEKQPYKDGYWLSYAGFVPGSAFTIDDVMVIFPDGFVRSYTGMVPSDVHYTNSRIVKYYVNSQYYQKFYQNHYNAYVPENYQLNGVLFETGAFLNEIDFYEFVLTSGTLSIAISGLPQDLQMVIQVKDAWKTITTGEPYRSLASLRDQGLLDKTMSSGAIIGELGPGAHLPRDYPDIAKTMQTLSELKKEETGYLETLLTAEDQSGWQSTFNSLISNLESQKSSIDRLKASSENFNVYIKRQEDIWLYSDAAWDYVSGVAGLLVDVSDADQENIIEELGYFKNF
jgi:hypothetical protein